MQARGGYGVQPGLATTLEELTQGWGHNIDSQKADSGRHWETIKYRNFVTEVVACVYIS